MTSNQVEFSSLDDLLRFFQELPDGTKSQGLPSDLEAGNFVCVGMEKPDGSLIEVSYTGPVAEGYVSPFETQPIEADI